MMRTATALLAFFALQASASPSLDERNLQSYGSYKCFDNGTELSSAVKEYVFGGNKSTTRYGPIIGEWCVGRVTDFGYVFYGLNFNEPLNLWNTSQATDMSAMFYNSTFDQPLNHFIVDRVQCFSWMFGYSFYTQPLDDWTTTSAVDMSYMFYASAFNSSVDTFTVDNVYNFSNMFGYSSYNQALLGWNTISAADMNSMFVFSFFNQPLSNFIVTKVTDFCSMFYGSAFNQDISSWVPSSAANMQQMFYSASAFNQNLCSWGSDLASSVNTINMFSGSACPAQNDPNFTAIPPGPFCQACVTSAPPTVSPTKTDTMPPTVAPTKPPTVAPTKVPSVAPSESPSPAPTESPSPAPTKAPTVALTEPPTVAPTVDQGNILLNQSLYWVIDVHGYGFVPDLSSELAAAAAPVVQSVFQHYFGGPIRSFLPGQNLTGRRLKFGILTCPQICQRQWLKTCIVHRCVEGITKMNRRRLQGPQCISVPGTQEETVTAMTESLDTIVQACHLPAGGLSVTLTQLAKYE